MLQLLLGMLLWAASPAHAKKVTVPLDLGIGPTVLMAVPGPVFEDQPAHFGLMLSAAVVIDQATLKANKKKIPKQYRKMATQMREVRIGKIYVPETLILSPPIWGTGMYGATWRPLSLGVPLVSTDGFSIDASAGLVLTAAFMHSTTLAAPWMVWLRPGLDLRIEAEGKLSDTVLISGGWTSRGYVPQVVGGNFFAVTPLDQAIIHVGQPFLMLHVRVPITTNL